MKTFVVTHPECGKQFCVYRDAANLVDAEIDSAEVGDSILITVKEMTEDEVNNLPDFEGW